MTENQPIPFQAEVASVLRLVINSLYGHVEVFLRELVSNAADALDRLRFQSLTQPELLAAGEELKIRILLDKKARTILIEDNGIGMTEAELRENLGTIARSGTREFLRKLQEAPAGSPSSLQLIGQFGVGFYSAYLVGDRVEVTSRKAGQAEAHRWVSDGKEGYELFPAERAGQGTSVLIHVKEDQAEFLEEFRIRQLVERYSDYVSHPIELGRVPEADDKAPEYQKANRANALWQRATKEITPEQYREFYKHLSHDWEDPVAWRHFHVEGTQMFTGLLFLPKQAPFDLFDPSSKHGVRLHVRRVLVMENSEELLPKWLRFFKGLVDSEDLPLNVSRETLQDSRIVRTIRKQVVQQGLALLEELEKERPADYEAFWETFGPVLKEGLHFDPEERTRISKLLRFSSSTEEKGTSLAGYVERMKPEQKDIYYAIGPSLSVLRASPHLESLRARGIEVLLLTDPVDPFLISNLPDFEGKPLQDAMSDKLDVPAAQGEKASSDTPQTEPLFERMKEILGERIHEVRASKRLTDSPVCLVQQQGALAPHIERMLRARQMEIPETKRILEVNRDHAVVIALRKLLLVDPKSSKLADWVELLHDQALIAEGSPVEDPARFAQRMAQLLADAAETALR